MIPSFVNRMYVLKAIPVFVLEIHKHVQIILRTHIPFAKDSREISYDCVE